MTATLDSFPPPPRANNMFDVFAQCATDPKLEVNGVWRDIGGTKLLIARANNRRYSKLLSKLFDQHREALDKEDDAADDLSDKIMVQVFAETILLGWETLAYKKGVELPYSLDNAKMVLAHSDFRVKVNRLSSEIDGYLIKEEGEQGKA